MAVYAYLRVSTDKQDGINQKRGVDALAVARGLTIDEYIDDEGKSGMLEPEKRELGKLLKKLKAGDILLAGEISRLGRSLFMIFRILEYCLNNGITIMTAKDGYTLGNDIQSKVMAFAFGLSAEIERDMISRRTKEALAVKKDKGIILGRHRGQFTKKHKLDDKIDELESMLEKGISQRQIAKALNVDRNTLYRYMILHGLKEAPECFSKIDKNLVKNLIHEGKNLLEIGETVNLNSSDLGLFLKINPDLKTEYQSFNESKVLKANGGLKICKPRAVL